MKYKNYIEMQKDHEKRYNEFQKGRIFYAYSDEQFNEGMKSVGLKENETDKIYRLFSGVYILRSESKAYHKLADDMDKEKQEHMQDFEFAKSAFTDELANHEYIYTYELDDTLNALGLTIEEVNKNPILKKALKEAREEYLKWHEEHGW